jgi:CheY-like chemotaxis protein
MENKRIFVADDDKYFRDDVAGYFLSLGYEVDTADTYHSATELLDKHTYLLIVCDKSMPIGKGNTPNDTCGLDILARTKLGELNYNVPFVINTGDDREGTKKRVEKLGGIYRYKHDRKVPFAKFFDELLAKLIENRP